MDEQAQTRFSLQHTHQISHDNADHLPAMQAGYTRTNFGSYQINWALVTTDTKHRQLRESQLHLFCRYPSPPVNSLCPCFFPFQCHIEIHRPHCIDSASGAQTGRWWSSGMIHQDNRALDHRSSLRERGSAHVILFGDMKVNMDTQEPENMPVHTCHASCGTLPPLHTTNHVHCYSLCS